VVQVGHRQSVQAIGIDIERRGVVTAEIHRQISAPAERHDSSPHMGQDVATLVFSAKEAFFKAYYPQARTFLDFTDVTLDIDWSSERFKATLIPSAAPGIGGGRSLQGRFVWIGPFVITGVWLPA
jgi:4'-phosphopantetheinyl transferase EntD